MEISKGKRNREVRIKVLRRLTSVANYAMFIDRKTKHLEKIKFPQIDIHGQCSYDQNPNGIFFRNLLYIFFLIFKINLF